MIFPPPAMNKPGSVGTPCSPWRSSTGTGTRLAPTSRGKSGCTSRASSPAISTIRRKGQQRRGRPGGWFRTGDTGYLDEDGFLFLTGRRNELINRGGDKIAPAEVDAVLLCRSEVAEAAVFPVPDSRFGQDVVAAVVLEPGQTVSPRELRTWMLERLAPHKVPRRIWFVETLPRTATGKVQRGELARRWQEAHG